MTRNANEIGCVFEETRNANEIGCVFEETRTDYDCDYDYESVLLFHDRLCDMGLCFDVVIHGMGLCCDDLAGHAKLDRCVVEARHV